MIAAALALGCAVPATAAVQPYGTNDAGGFRNVLPPGEQGVDNAIDLAQFTALGRRPRHWDDQQQLYEGLLYASPSLVHSDIGRFYKDATFGTRNAERTYSPRPGVTIVRDNWGVPHVYGDTRGDVEFGAGYAGAEDRLFLMDVLRHTGRAQLSSFIGGAAGNREMDRTQWSIGPVYRGRPPAPDRPGAAGLRLARQPAGEQPQRLRRRHQRLHRPHEDRPDQAAGRVRRAGLAAAEVAGHRRDRRGIAYRRDLRKGRRPGAALGDAAQVAGEALRPPARPRRLAGLPQEGRPGDGEHGDPQALPVRARAGAVEARPGATRSRLGAVHAAGRTGGGVVAERRVGRGAAVPVAPGAARLELGDGERPPLAHGPSDRRPRPAGGLLRAPDPDGGGAARVRLRRPPPPSRA